MFIEIYQLVQVALIPVMILEFHLNFLEASLVATLPNIVALLTYIPFGILADRFDTNHLLGASMLAEGLAAFFVSQTSSFWTLVLGVSLMKLSSPLYHISGLSRISRLSKPERISRSIGFHNALGSFGSGLGVISLTVFLSSLSWRWVYLFWSFPIIAWGFIVLTYAKLKAERVEYGSKQDQGGRLAKLTLIFSSGLLFFLIIFCIRQFGAIGSSTFMTTFFVEIVGLSETMASLIFGLGPFIGIVGALFGGYLTERLTAKTSLSLVTIICSIALFVLSLTSEANVVIIVFILYAFFNSTIWSPLNTIVARITPAALRGLSYSFYFSAEGIIASIAPAFTGAVIELTDVWFFLPFSITFLITSVILLQFQNRNIGQRKNAETDSKQY